MKGSIALLTALQREGVEVIFGYPGGQVIPIYDALYDFDLDHILTRHEQGAVHAADGYARASGKVGVCLATSGPGATNLVTGIANAYMDSVPLVAITGQVRRALIGTDAFQEADIPGITLPIVKHSYLVQEAADIPRIVHEAFHIARTGQAGAGVDRLPQRPQLRGRRLRPRGAHHDRPARLQAHDQGAPQADPRGGEGHRRGRAAHDLRGRRASSRPTPRPSCASWRCTPTSRSRTR